MQSQLRSKHIRTLEVLHSVVTENAELKETVEKLKEIKKSQDKTKEFENETNELKLQISTLKESVEHIRSERDEAYHDLQNLGNQVAKLETELEETKRERESGYQAIQSLKRSSGQVIESLKKSLVKSKENCRNTKTKLSDLNKKNEELETKLRMFIGESSNTKERLRELEEKRKTHQEDKESKIRNSRKEYAELLKRFHQQQMELDSFREMKVRHEALLREHAELDVTCKDTTKELLRCKKENEQLRRRLKDSKDTMANGSNFAKFVSLKEENRELASKLKKFSTRRKNR